jgi:hypothetical protein
MQFIDFLHLVKPYTMTSEARIKFLFDSLEYIRINNIEGDIIECGVWKGGNILGVMEYLHYHRINDKKVWLFDTFSGMTEPEDIDVDLKNVKAIDILDKPIVLACSPLNEVKNNLAKSNFNSKNLVFVVGDVSETLKIETNIPKKISLLRLDTDWYKSTKDELTYLYPNLVKNGVLIVDDYGHWKGSKLAFDEYFASINVKPKITEIDYTGIGFRK